MLADLASLTAAAAWVGVAALGGLPFLIGPEQRPTLADLAVAATLGLCSAGLAWIVVTALGGSSFAALAAATALVVPAATTLYRRGWRATPARFDVGPGTIAVWLVFLIWFAPVAVGAVRMGTGPYPSMFFNVDTPFRLTHVRELARSDRFPPLSSSNVGTVGANHYGAAAAATVMTALTGFPPHTALFAIVLPVAALGTFAATLLICRRLSGTIGGTLTIALLLLVLTSWLWPIPEVVGTAGRTATERTGTPLQSFAAELWRDPQSFNNYFEDVTHLIGRTLFLLACLPLVTSGSRSRWTAAVAVVLLGQVKTGHALIAGIALAVSALVEAVRTRRGDVFIPPAIAAALSAAFIKLGSVGGLFTVHLQPFWMLSYSSNTVERHVLAFLIIAVAPVAAATAAGRGAGWRGEWRSRILPPVVATAAIYAFFLMVGASWPGRSWVPGVPPTPGPFAAFLEPLLQIPTLFAIIGGAGVAALWPSLRPAGRAGAVLVIAVLALPALAHRTRGTLMMIASPAMAHEQVDNRAIAGALETIPVRTAVIATNDLRYPADGYARDLLQYQIPAVMGHQAFGLPGYDRYPAWETRVLLQRALGRPVRSCSALRALADAGVTHILLHKLAPHPDSLPLTRTYDSDRYAVYELGNARVCDEAGPR